MNALLIHGNPNYHTFTNAIVAANEKAMLLFNSRLSNIFILHSKRSYQVLNEKTEWLQELEKHQITSDIFTQKIVEIDASPDSVKAFVEFIELILKGMPEKSNLMLDVTNGTTVQKSLLAIVAYLLDFPHQYMIDITQLAEKVKEIKGFLPPAILEACYVPVPESVILDHIAYINLAEVLRYKKMIEGHKQKYVTLNPDKTDPAFFKGNIARSIQLKFSGDQNDDPTIYRISASALAASLEHLVRIMVDKYIKHETVEDKDPFGPKLKLIERKVYEISPPNFDFKFMELLNGIMLYIRNTTTHKTKALGIIEKIKAELSMRMVFPFIQFYTDVLLPILANAHQKDNQTIEKLPENSKIQSTDDQIYYIGIDGDNTGAFLENLFLSSAKDSEFSKLSGSVENALIEIKKKVKAQYGKQAVIFAAGDDILYKAPYHHKFIEELQQSYEKETSGLTCSVGAGKTLKEVYVALKIAKTTPGKNRIVKL